MAHPVILAACASKDLSTRCCSHDEPGGRPSDSIRSRHRRDHHVRPSSALEVNGGMRHIRRRSAPGSSPDVHPTAGFEGTGHPANLTASSCIQSCPPVPGWVDTIDRPPNLELVPSPQRRVRRLRPERIQQRAHTPIRSSTSLVEEQNSMFRVQRGPPDSKRAGNAESRRRTASSCPRVGVRQRRLGRGGTHVNQLRVGDRATEPPDQRLFVRRHENLRERRRLRRLREQHREARRASGSRCSSGSSTQKNPSRVVTA